MKKTWPRRTNKGWSEEKREGLRRSRSLGKIDCR